MKTPGIWFLKFLEAGLIGLFEANVEDLGLTAVIADNYRREWEFDNTLKLSGIFSLHYPLDLGDSVVGVI